MTLLVHITAENRAAIIRRTGIAATRWRPQPAECPQWDRAVWAFPVLPSYTLPPSWARELKRSGRSTLAAVTFRIRDDELVYARHFSTPPQPMTAASASGLIRAAEDARGYEIMVLRRVQPREIVRIQILPRATGWRYWPAAKGRTDAPVRLSRVPAARRGQGAAI